MLIFYDFEVFKYDWLVVLHSIPDGKRTRICNSVEQLEDFYDEHKKDIWVGFNSRSYDQYILKGILCGFNPHAINEWIITKKKHGSQYSRLFKEIKLYNYDVFSGKTDYGLKTLEGFMGHNIKETSIPFNLDRKLTSDEVTETFKYCDHDVDELMEVFIRRKDEFDTHINMIKEFKLPLDNINLTTSQLLANILGASSRNFNDDYNIKLPPTLKLSKYRPVADWFLNNHNEAITELDKDIEGAKEFLKIGLGSKKVIRDMQKLVQQYTNDYNSLLADYTYSRSLKIDIGRVEHIFAWGGVHGALPQFTYVCKPDEILIMADVRSLYPSLMIEYNLQSRAISDLEIYKKIYNINVEMKKNNDPRRPIYKLACNISYGCMGDKFNNLYDKRNQNLVCVFGQLLILDLIEKLENHCKLIQTNTDGILILIKRKDFNIIDDIVAEWEERTRLNMEFTYAKKIYQGDVNNYVMVKYDGRFKSKGAYVKKLSSLDNDLPIVNKAITDYLVSGIPIEKTINDCNQLIMFQKIVKLTVKYDFVTHNGKRYDWKSYRVFASTNENDGMIYKNKNGANPAKFANTPECCFIENSDISSANIDNRLNKNYYIALARKRLKDKFNL